MRCARPWSFRPSTVCCQSGFPLSNSSRDSCRLIFRVVGNGSLFHSNTIKLRATSPRCSASYTSLIPSGRYLFVTRSQSMCNLSSLARSGFTTLPVVSSGTLASFFFHSVTSAFAVLI